MPTFRPVPSYIDSTIETILTIHKEERQGDILAFLTGQEEVETTVKKLKYIQLRIWFLFNRYDREIDYHWKVFITQASQVTEDLRILAGLI